MPEVVTAELCKVKQAHERHPTAIVEHFVRIGCKHCEETARMLNTLYLVNNMRPPYIEVMPVTK